MKSPENMAGNSATGGLKREVRHFANEVLTAQAVNEAKREYGQANKGPWWMP